MSGYITNCRIEFYSIFLFCRVENVDRGVGGIINGEASSSKLGELRYSHAMSPMYFLRFRRVEKNGNKNSYDPILKPPLLKSVAIFYPTEKKY